MSSYFDKFDQQVNRLAQEIKDTEEFLHALMALEAGMVKTCEYFAGDRDTPHDIREAVIKHVLTYQVRYEGGDFMGSHVAGLKLECEATTYAAVMRQSKLSKSLHHLFHHIASLRIETRYGRIMDNPEAAVRARDRYVEEKFG